ncbi:hypothetical protein [Ktedonosporobacter rubrisoli]|nr:hypothetical protein [Ktedonosporobacter rubrisoli]
MVHDVQGIEIPRLFTLRRVSAQYWRILPLKVMKRYQCIVIGKDRGGLTLAIADQKVTGIIEQLSKLTGYEIFPVLVDPVRIRLLLRRIERAERDWHNEMRQVSPARLVQARSILLSIATQAKRS